MIPTEKQLKDRIKRLEKRVEDLELTDAVAKQPIPYVPMPCPVYHPPTTTMPGNDWSRYNNTGVMIA